MTTKRTRGYSREFPTGLGVRRRLEVDWVPPGLLRDAKRKAKRERVSLRVLCLRYLRDWVAS